MRRSCGHALACATGQRLNRGVALASVLMAFMAGVALSAGNAVAQNVYNNEGTNTTETQTPTENSTTTKITGTDANATVVDTRLAGGATIEVGTTGTVTVVANTDGTSTVTVENSTISTDATVPANQTVVVENTTTVNGSFTVDSGGTLSGNATFINVTNNDGGNVNPGTSPGIMQITGTFTNTGTQTIEIDGATAGTGAGFHDQVLGVGNNAAYVAGGTLAPVTRGISAPADNDFTPIVGQGFTIVSNATVSGAFATVTQPTTGLLSNTQFDVVYDTSDITIHVTPSNFNNLESSGISLSENEVAAASGLQSFRPTAGQRLTGDNKTIFDNLFPRSAEDLEVIYNQVSGSTTASVATSGVFTAQAMGDVLDRRANHERIVGQTSITEMAALGLNGGETSGGTGWAAWVQPIGQIGSVDGDGNGIGFDRDAIGGMLGIEGQASGAVFGVSFGYAYEDLDFDSIGAAGGNNAEVDSYYFGGYGSFTTGNIFISGNLGYTWKDIDTSRNINFGTINRTASGSTDGGLFSIAGKVGYTAAFSGAIVEPSFGLAYQDFNMDGFTETGANNLNVTYGDQDFDSLQSQLGVRVAFPFEGTSGLVVVPELRAAWEQELLDSRPDISAQFAGGGNTFTVSGSEPGDATAVLGAGVKAQITDQLDVFADYNGRISKDQNTHGITAGLRFRF